MRPKLSFRLSSPWRWSTVPLGHLRGRLSSIREPLSRHPSQCFDPRWQFQSSILSRFPLGDGRLVGQSKILCFAAQGPGPRRALAIAIGGARESLLSDPYTARVYLKNRKGFIKVAIKTGSSLVPCYAFGEDDAWELYSPKVGKPLELVQRYCKAYLGFTIPYIRGQPLILGWGLMPFRAPIRMIVGNPIHTGKPDPSPSASEIDRFHELYIAELQRIWEAGKESYGNGRTGGLVII